MKISIITPVFNALDSIEDCIKSVIDQKNAEIEHIIVDGGSTDGTLEIIKFFGKSISLLLSGQDRGVFDAMNKGILISTGEVIGILNSDDFYGSTDVLSTVNEFLTKFGTDSCFGDLDYVSRKDKSKIVRRWRSKEFYPELFRKGWMPPHPAFFVKKKFFDTFGFYNLNFPLASDYELMLNKYR
jgi:glycosyltransferase involved in cell wall biosynthesis